MIQLHHEIDFSPHTEFIQQACEELVKRDSLENNTLLHKPIFKLDLGVFLIVSNLPVVPEEKQKKFQSVFENVLNKTKSLKDQWENVILNFKGQALVKFKSEESAQVASKELTGFPITKTQNLMAYTIKEFETIQKTDDTFKELKLLNKKSLFSWLMDPRQQLLYVQEKGRQQYVIDIQENRFSLNWFEPLNQEFEEIIKEKNIPDQLKVQWSPSGGYLVVFMSWGIQLYGGSQLEELGQFKHENVKEVVFSRNEEYILSYNGTTNQENGDENYIVWKIKEQQKLRVFSAQDADLLGTFQFSDSGKYLGRIENDFLSIYEQPNFYLKSEGKYEVGHVQNFAWIKKKDLIIYGCHSGTNRNYEKPCQKSYIGLISAGTPCQAKWRNLQFECQQMDFFSHEYGNWVCAVMKKKVKKRIVGTVIQVGSLKKLDQQNISVADYNDLNEEIDQVYFESRTGRFALGQVARDKIQLLDQRALPFYNFYFFCVLQDQFVIKSMGNLINKDCNELLWANNGVYFALVNRNKGSSDQGKLEFGVVQRKQEEGIVSFSLEITKQTNHFYMSHSQWTSSGTYFITMSDKFFGIIIWSAIGEQLFRDTINNITEVYWRPYEFNNLTEKDEEEFNKTNKSQIKKYELDDDKIVKKAKYEREQKRSELKSQVSFLALLEQKRQRWKDSREQRKQLLGFDEDDTSELVSKQIIEYEEILQE